MLISLDYWGMETFITQEWAELLLLIILKIIVFRLSYQEPSKQLRIKSEKGKKWVKINLHLWQNGMTAMQVLWDSTISTSIS